MTTRMLTNIGIALGTVALIALAGCREGREPAAVVAAVENQRFCPVMDDMQINKDVYVDHEGERVYFCCPGCIPAFRADPDKYMEKLKEIHAERDHAPQPEAHEHVETP